MDDLMSKIANGEVDSNSSEELSEIDTTKEQIKLFMLAEAKQNLLRIVKMTNFLNKVEDKFQEKITECLDDDSLSLDYYSEVIGVITTSLQRSSDIVSRVLKDDTLANLVIINNDNSTNKNITNNSGQISNILASSDSRDRVSKAVQKVLGMVENNINEIEGEQ